MSFARRIFPEPDRREATFLGEVFRRETVGGAIALAAAVVGIVWALVNGNGEGWTSPIIVAAFAVGAVFLAAFLWSPAPQ